MYYKNFIGEAERQTDETKSIMLPTPKVCRLLRLSWKIVECLNQIVCVRAISVIDNEVPVFV